MSQLTAAQIVHELDGLNDADLTRVEQAVASLFVKRAKQVAARARQLANEARGAYRSESPASLDAGFAPTEPIPTEAP